MISKADKIPLRNLILLVVSVYAICYVVSIASASIISYNDIAKLAAQHNVTVDLQILHYYHVKPVPKEVLLHFVAEDPTNKRKYGDWICIDFAHHFATNLSRTGYGAVGVLIVQRGETLHAANWAIIENNGTLSLVCVEPQTDYISYEFKHYWWEGFPSGFSPVAILGT